MEKSIFFNVLPKIKEITLPGIEAHSSLSPPDRIHQISTNLARNPPPKQAAVMICCYPKLDNLFYFPLIHRTEYPGVHSGQISLPGGKMESQDRNLWHTATRELNEELGVRTQDLKQIRQLSSLYIPPSNFWVTPYLGFLDTPTSFIPEKREVADVIEVSLDALTALILEKRKLETSYLKRQKIPGYALENHYVWGATAMILTELKMILSSLTHN